MTEFIFLSGCQRITDDLHDVLERATQSGIETILVTAGSLSECREAHEKLQLFSQQLSENQSYPKLYTTIGVHPTRGSEFLNSQGGPQAHLAALRALLETGTSNKSVVAIGECGLDYDRLEFCSKEIQIAAFELQFELARDSSLPMFLHCRAAAEDMIALLRKHKLDFAKGGGVIHSFDGSLEDALIFTKEFGLYIGLNGCSLKTQENLEIVKELPLDRVLIESDAPWCDLRPTHASIAYLSKKAPLSFPWPTIKKERWTKGHFVKGRNEPAASLPHILKLIAALKDLPMDRVAAQIYDNSLRLFFPNEARD